MIGLGNDRYEIQIIEEFDKRADFKVKTEAFWKDGKMTFDQNGYSSKITADSFTGKKAVGAFDTPFSLKRAHRVSPTLGAKAPANAVVLLDGTNLDVTLPIMDGKRIRSLPVSMKTDRATRPGRYELRTFYTFVISLRIAGL